MNYSELLQESNSAAQNYGSATKILDSIQKLEEDSTDASKRRWIWELLQNAKDVKTDQGISIEINLHQAKEEAFIEFKHDGQPFAIKHLAFLVQQVSSKDRNNSSMPSKTTGKFGTGFLTTHLLSKKVQLEGFLQEADNPYTKFSIFLDRSGNTLEEVIASVDRANTALKQIVNNPISEDYNPSAYNTVFRYELNQDGIGTARIGLDDLQNCIAFTLAFIPELKKITMLHENIVYETSEINELTDGIKCTTVLKKQDKNILKETIILSISKDSVTVALEIEVNGDDFVLKPIDKNVPKLFCEFPLVGSECFNFPVVINSPRFNPNEPRSGIALANSSDSNKRVMLEATSLYCRLLDFACTNDFKNLYILANIKNPDYRLSWQNEKLFPLIQAKILSASIVETENDGKKSIKDTNSDIQIYFPVHGDAIIREKIWHLGFALLPKKMPVFESIHHWYSIGIHDWKVVKQNSSYSQSIQVSLTIEMLSQTVANQKNLQKLIESYFESKSICIKWLNELVALITNTHKDRLLNDKDNPILPNQKGIFLHKDILFLDDGSTDEILKDIAEKLGYDCRFSLLDKAIISLEMPNKRTEADIATEITNQVRKRLGELDRDREIKLVFKDLYVWLNNNAEKAASLFAELYPIKHRLYDDSDIIANMEKAKTLDDILENSKINIEQLKEIVKKGTEQIPKEETPISIAELMMRLGVSSLEDLEKAFQDDTIASQFFYAKPADATPEDFFGVQAKIKRAKENVLLHLKRISEAESTYDLSELDVDVAPTVMGGIKKNGVEIYVVVRPSDYGYVIFYSGSEIDTLEESNAELWVDNGQNTPRQLTLGNVLKVTNITKVPICH